MMTMEIVKGGLQTTIQDYPGRIGMLRHGVPPSGPQDDWSFRLANLLVGNPSGTAALECQFVGPEILFHQDTLIAVCGADMGASLDGRPVSLWQTREVKRGQILRLAGATAGARAYIAVAGGVVAESTMGAKATYVTAALGGVDGKPLAPGQSLKIGTTTRLRSGTDYEVRASAKPRLPDASSNAISIVLGPNDDWISDKGKRDFFGAEWKLTSRSNRVGYRIQGPKIDYSDIALKKGPQHGDHPSNIIDIGYPIGGINWAGDTPIILMHDCITLGGFFVPFTVPSCEFWKLAQARPGSILKFEEISVQEAQSRRRAIDQCCAAASIIATVN